ncbi:MAG: putative lipid II flippase FtsW [Candidatus Levybacteria bacterium]|nr:putative lipid II flippase FtsW [Candidatus Levybacteria bacterium]
MIEIKRVPIRKSYFVFLLAVLALTIFGLFMIYDASSYIAFRDFGDKYHYIKDQTYWVLIGFIALSVFSFFDYHKYYNLALPILLSAIFLLFMVFIPGLGVEALGAKRWINLGFFVLQPGEFIKLALTIYLAAWFSTREKGRFFAFLLLIGLVILLIMLQPDMGTAAVILGVAVVLYFLSGGSVFHILGLIPIIGLGGLGLILLEPYRAERLSTFLNPHQNLETTSYHLRQILIALGSGGLFGVGLGNSLQKYAYLPEATTDSIFAIAAEEVGFVGVTIVILIMLFIIYRGFYIAFRAKDNFGRLLAGGIASYLAIQIIVNLGAQTALLPLTGVPLPFISYGGSALTVNLISVGILINISRQSHHV